MPAGIRRSLVVVVSILVMSGSSSPVHADDSVVTNQRVAIRKSPEESAKPIRHLAPGTDVTILKRDGRWLYVKAGKTRGWITRTTIDERPAPKTEPSETWGDKAEGWGDGESATRAASYAADEPAARDVEAVDGDDADGDDRPARPRPPAAMAVSGQLGFRSVGMDFTSDGAQPGANYIITAQSAATIAGVHAAGRLGQVLIRGNLTYRGAYSDPGVRYQASTGGTDDISLTSHEIDADLRVGARASASRGGVDVLGRVGYMYGAYLVDDLGNLGRLPNESLQGFVVGASIRIGRITDSATLEIEASTMIGGSRNQTSGLEDGMATTASATWGRARVSHELSKHLELVGEYGYSSRVTVWEGGSARHSDVTRADRRDTLHTFAAGIARSF